MSGCGWGGGSKRLAPPSCVRPHSAWPARDGRPQRPNLAQRTNGNRQGAGVMGGGGRGPEGVAGGLDHTCLSGWLQLPRNSYFCWILPGWCHRQRFRVELQLSYQSPRRPVLIPPPPAKPKSKLSGSSLSFGTTLPPNSEINWSVSSHV